VRFGEGYARSGHGWKMFYARLHDAWWLQRGEVAENAEMMCHEGRRPFGSLFQGVRRRSCRRNARGGGVLSSAG
jgi:hypothetical protein